MGTCRFKNLQVGILRTPVYTPPPPPIRPWLFSQRFYGHDLIELKSLAVKLSKFTAVVRIYSRKYLALLLTVCSIAFVMPCSSGFTLHTRTSIRSSGYIRIVFRNRFTNINGGLSFVHRRSA
jgi:hypothetical protein